MSPETGKIELVDWEGDFVIGRATVGSLPGWTITIAVDRSSDIVDLRFAADGPTPCALTARRIREVPVDWIRRQVVVELRQLPSRLAAAAIVDAGDQPDRETMKEIQKRLAALPNAQEHRALFERTIKGAMAKQAAAEDWASDPGGSRRRRESDLQLAHRAQDYVDEAGHRDSNRRLSAKWFTSTSNVTEIVRRLRGEFLTPAPAQGKSGGELTPKALQLLEQEASNEH